MGRTKYPMEVKLGRIHSDIRVYFEPWQYKLFESFTQIMIIFRTMTDYMNRHIFKHKTMAPRQYSLVFLFQWSNDENEKMAYKSYVGVRMVLNFSGAYGCGAYKEGVCSA